MNTVTAIEAERVVQIISNAIDRLQLLAHVPSVTNTSVIADINCPTVLFAMQRQFQAEDYLVGESRDDTMDIATRDIAKMKKMHRAIRATCRNMQVERASIDILNRPETKNEEFIKFVKYLDELKGQVYSRMTTTVEDESANRSLLYDLTERERQAEREAERQWGRAR